MKTSWQRIGQLAIAGAAAGALLVSAVPDADAARKASMANNRLIEDKNDVYLFPQLSVDYARLLSLEYGAAQGSGSGLLLLGDQSLAYGVGIYRGDLLDNNLYPYDLGHPNLGGITNPLDGLAPDPLTIVDLFAAMDLGGASAGLRLSAGSGGDTAVDEYDDLDAATQTFLAATLGFSIAGDLSLDTSLNFAYSGGRLVVSDDDIYAANSIDVGATIRGYSWMDPSTALGFLVDVYYNNTGLTAFGDDTDPDDDDVRIRGNALALFAGAGPVFHLEENTKISAYGVIGHVRTTDAYDLDDEDELRSFGRATILPGLHVAADIQLLSWLYFRTGAQYHYGFATGAQEVDIEGDDEAVNDVIRSTDRFDGFGWRAGLGIEVNNFTFDGAFQAGFLTNGPDFLGGNGGGMFTSVAAGYRF